MSDPGEDFVLRVDASGIVRLTWRSDLRIDGALAGHAMSRVDELNGTTERAMLVDMTGTAALTRDARLVFGRRCSATRIALLGRSEVDRVIANFFLSVGRVPVPTRFFTSEATAVDWLLRVDTATDAG